VLATRRLTLFFHVSSQLLVIIHPDNKIMDMSFLSGAPGHEYRIIGVRISDIVYDDHLENWSELVIPLTHGEKLTIPLRKQTQ